MKTIIFNCGSSSLKYKVLDMPSETELAGGEAQRVGPPTAEPSRIIHQAQGKEQIFITPMPDHGAAFAAVMKILTEDTQLSPQAVGHRLVHGGQRFSHPEIVSEKALADLAEVEDLAPLHNPPAFTLIRACRQRFPTLPQVMVFDTSYHSTIPEYARTYALPQTLSRELGLYKYGFHGTSHQFVVNEAAKFFQIPVHRFHAVSCHLGSGGASLCAVRNGKSIDNTMGYSPLQGLIMSTRCGDLDPAVTLQLLARANGDYREVEKTLNRNSGVLGLSGYTADISDILSEMNNQTEPNPRLSLTAQIYLWRIRKYLGAYLTLVGNPHAVLFTDTIGENIPQVRWAVCANMEFFGLQMDPERNAHPGKLPANIAAPESPVQILVLKTNEELAIARSTYSLLAEAA